MKRRKNGKGRQKKIIKKEGEVKGRRETRDEEKGGDEI